MTKFSLVTALCVSVSLLWGCGKGGQGAASQAKDVETTASKTASPEMEKLKGSWMRADGDYVLEIAQVDGAGKMDAKYFNPNPINVSKALAIRENSTTRIFVELQDTGYPGCTYSLTYDAASDQLFGQYYQAAMDQTYDVVFARLKREQQ